MAFGMKAGITPEILSAVLGILSGALLLIFLALLSERHIGARHPLAWGPSLVLASSRSFTGWCSGGLETMFFTLLIFLAAVSFLKERREGARIPLASCVLFSLAALTRPEGAIFAAVSGLLFFIDLLRGRCTLRSFLIWAGVLCLLVGGHLLWRRAYYGFWLPNTFYVKVSGIWWEQARHYFGLFQSDYRIAWFLPLLPVPFFFARRRIYTLFSSLTITYLLYVAMVGGDRFEFRFLVVVFPFFYWMLWEGMRLPGTLRTAPPVLKRFLRLSAPVLFAALLFLTIHGSVKTEREGIRHNIVSIHAAEGYAERRISEGRFLRELIDEGILPADLYACVSGAGAVPYYTMWPTLDELGLNDVEIAHQPVTKRGIIAHEKKASPDFLRQRRVELWDEGNRIVRDNPGRHGHRGDNGGCWKTIRVRGRYLVFITFLSDKQFRNRFNHPALIYN